MEPSLDSFILLPKMPRRMDSELTIDEEFRGKESLSETGKRE